jgi:zinc protease
MPAILVGCGSNFISGKLDNGTAYYIRENSKPTDKVILRMAVRAGSADETEEQRGLAHLLEHMAFNGSTNFPKNSLIKYLESLGIKYGPELNAHTSFNETVYKLEIPLEDEATLDTGLQVLQDWAYNLTLDDESINQEREVVIEEYRSRRNANYRTATKYWPLLFNGTKYSERLPIGTLENLLKFKPQMVRDFYKANYTPERIAIIATGDINSSKLLKKIEKMFGHQKSEKSVEAYRGKLPETPANKFLSVQDKELQYTLVRVMKNLEPDDNNFVNRLKHELFVTAASSRFEEIAASGRTEILDTGVYTSRIIAPAQTISFVYLANDNQIPQSMEQFFVELKRIKEHNFSETEINSAKQIILEQLLSTSRESENIESEIWVSEYVESFIYNDKVLSPAKKYKIAQKEFSTFTQQDMQAVIDSIITPDSLLTVAAGPGKIPPATKLNKAARIGLSAATEKMDFGQIITDLATPELTPAKCKSVKKNKTYGTTEFILANGARVILKQTDFKEYEVLFSHISSGGFSEVSDDNIADAKFLEELIPASGAGSYTYNSLSNWQEEKGLELNYSIDKKYESFSGKFKASESENFFKLLHLKMTEPTIEKDNLERLRKTLLAIAANKQNEPFYIYQEKIRAYLSQNNPRIKDLTTSQLKKVSAEKAFKIFQEKISNQADDLYIFSGNISKKQLKPLLEKYIATIGTADKSEYKNTTMPYPSESAKILINKGIEDKATVNIIYTGKMKWSAQNRESINILSYALDTELNEVIREEMGGTYSIYSYGRIREFPWQEYIFIIGFSCDPAEEQQLTKAVLKEVENIRKDVKELHLDNYRKNMMLSRKEAFQTDSFWITAFNMLYKEETNKELILDKEQLLEKIEASDITATADKIFSGTKSEAKLFPGK